MPKKFVGEPFCALFQKITGIKKFYRERGPVTGSSAENFLSRRAEKFRRGTLLCFTEFLVSKKFMEKREGVSRVYVENSLSHFAKKFVGEPISGPLFWVSKIFRDKRGVSRFSVENIFVSQCRKIS